MVDVVVEPDEVARIQAKAADFLESYRDAGAGDIPIGPADRLIRSNPRRTCRLTCVATSST